MPDDLRIALGVPRPVVAVPINVVEHIRVTHPRDAAILNNLPAIIATYEYIQRDQERSDRIIFYSQFGKMWRRGVIVAAQHEHAPSILVTLYRRDETKIRKAIDGGLLIRRGQGGWK